MDKALKKKLIVKEGLVMAIIRPADPAKAMERGQQILKDSQSGKIDGAESLRQMNAMLREQEYTYRGLAGKDQKIYAEDGSVVEEMQPGDSFVPYNQIREMLEKQGSS